MTPLDSMLGGLEEMEKHADPAPWSCDFIEHGDEITDQRTVSAPSPSFRTIAHIEKCYHGARTPEQESVHQRLIAAARNALPTLLALARLAVEARGWPAVEKVEEFEYEDWLARFDALAASVKGGE